MMTCTWALDLGDRRTVRARDEVYIKVKEGSRETLPTLQM